MSQDFEIRENPMTNPLPDPDSIEIPDDPRVAYQLVKQSLFDAAIEGLEKLQQDQHSLRELDPESVRTDYVLDILRITIALSVSHLVQMDEDELRPDQVKVIDRLIEENLK